MPGNATQPRQIPPPSTFAWQQRQARATHVRRPRCASVVVLTAADRLSKLYADTIASQMAWAAHHNYTYAYEKRPLARFANRTCPMCWSKMQYVRDRLASSQQEGEPRRCVLWLDADVLVTTPSLSLEAVLSKATGPTADGACPHSASLIFSGDTNVINDGVFLVASSAWARRAFDTIISMYPASYGMDHDNAAFAAYLGGCPRFNRTAAQCYASVDNTKGSQAQRLIEAGNAAAFVHASRRRHVCSVPKKAWNSYPQEWAPHHFAIHFAGLKDKAQQHRRIKAIIENRTHDMAQQHRRIKAHIENRTHRPARPAAISAEASARAAASLRRHRP